MGSGTWDLSSGTWDFGPGTLDLGPGTWDLGPGTRLLALGQCNLGPVTWDLALPDWLGALPHWHCFDTSCSHHLKSLIESTPGVLAATYASRDVHGGASMPTYYATSFGCPTRPVM